MAIKLVLKNVADSDQVEEYIFNKEQVTIGRDRKNDLHIPDPNRVVGRRHAEISAKEEGYVIADLESKNSTYLNNNRLAPGKNYALEEGDTFRMGDYEVEFSLFNPEPEPVVENVVEEEINDHTVLDIHAINPFTEEAEQLQVLLASLAAKYEEEPERRRKEALSYALMGMQLESEELVAVLAEALGVQPEPADTAAPTEPAEPAEAPKASSDAHEPAMPAWRENVLDVVLNLLSLLLSIPGQFRHEFVGHTVAQRDELEALFNGDSDGLKAYLLDQGVEEQERRDRLALLHKGSDAVLLHQLAMLDGYRAVVMQGMHMLLREIDPDAAEEAMVHENTMYRVVPAARKMAASRRMRAKIKELRGEDWSVTERRAYRPVFIRAYLERMSSEFKRPNGG